MATAKKTTPMVVPLSALRGACRKQLAIVRKEWPDGIPLTAKAMRRCLDLKLDLDWAAMLLLDAASWDEYLRMTARALAEHNRALATAAAEYNRLPSSEAAWAEYAQATATAAAKYQRVKQPVLLRLLRKQYRKGAAT